MYSERWRRADDRRSSNRSATLINHKGLENVNASSGAKIRPRLGIKDRLTSYDNVGTPKSKAHDTVLPLAEQ